MPQLDSTFFHSQIFWLLISLVILYFYLAKIFIPRIKSHIQSRQQLINSKLAMAEKISRKAINISDKVDKKLTQTKQNASDIITKAKTDSQVDLDSKRNEFTKLIDKRLEASKNYIDDSTNKVRKQIPQITSQLTQSIIGKLSGDNRD